MNGAEDGRADHVRLSHALAERMKELSALHEVARRLQQNRPATEELLRELAELLPPAWQYPDVCEGRIRYDQLEGRTPGWQTCQWQQTEAFTTSDGRVGSIEVAYREERPAEAEGPFLMEERLLLRSLASMLTTYLDRQRAEEDLRALSGRVVTAQEDDRRRIARELHDEIGQTLTIVRIDLQSLCESLPSEATSVHGCIQNVDRAIQEVRVLAHRLHPSILDHLGLPAALRWFIDRLPEERPTMHLAIQDNEDGALSTDIAMAAYRIAQEAVTNILRHANALNVWVSLTRRCSELELSVRDDGRGFDLVALRRSRTATLGLSCMEERIRLVRGRLEIRSSPGAGTEVWARFSVDPT